MCKGKNKLLVRIFSVCATSLFLFGEANAQTDTSSAWQPMHLNVSGSNIVNGVEASFQLNKCNGEDVVFVKFINRNTHAVEIEWYDAVFTQEKKWIKKENAADKKSLSIPANSEVVGDCAGKNELMVVKMKSFDISPTMLQFYSASQFSISSK